MRKKTKLPENFLARKVIDVVKNYSVSEEINFDDKTPLIISIPLVRGHSLKHRLLNTFSAVPLRLIRKSTMDYWLHQEQIVNQFNSELEVIKERVSYLEENMEVVSSKKDN